jgi:hypothetical protein
MATPATKAELNSLPRTATITVRNKEPYPPGEVEVTPEAGRVYFENKDSEDYRVRFWPKENPAVAIDLLLIAGGSLAVVIKPNDEFSYSVAGFNDLDKAATNGPIKN